MNIERIGWPVVDFIRRDGKERISFGKDATISSVAIKRLSEADALLKSPDKVLQEMWWYQKLFWVPAQVKTISGIAMTVLVNRFSWAKRFGGWFWQAGENICRKFQSLCPSPKQVKVSLSPKEITELPFVRKVVMAQRLLRQLGLPVCGREDPIWEDLFVVDSLAYHSQNPKLHGFYFHVKASSKDAPFVRGVSFYKERLYIHKNKCSQGDKKLGEGGESQVKKAICLYKDSQGLLRKEDVVRITPAWPLYQEDVESSPKFSGDLSWILTSIVLEDPPHIAKVIDYTEYKGRRRFKTLQVQKYYPEGDLEHNLHKLTERDQKSLILSLLQGLFWLHKRNILHCDIKPENILVEQGKEGMVGCITDFGCAKYLKRDVKQEESSATMYYNPPESGFKHLGEGKFEPIDPDWYKKFSRDIWAAGITVLHILDRKRIAKSMRSSEDAKQGLERYKGSFLYPLLEGMLARTAEERISAEKALELAQQLCSEEA